MPENKNGLLVTLVVLVALLAVVSMFVTVNNKVDEKALTDKIVAQVIGQIDIPTASEIAAEIVVPEVVVPEPKEVNSDRIDDLWEDLYGNEIEELETEAYDVAELELEDHDYELLTEWLEANIEGFDELEDVDIEDHEVNVIALGLDDEDKVAEIIFELEVRYSLLEGVVQDLKKQVIATASVSFDEGDFSDEDVELVFA